jgi:hypothetical protein
MDACFRRPFRTSQAPRVDCPGDRRQSSNYPGKSDCRRLAAAFSTSVTKIPRAPQAGALSYPYSNYIIREFLEARFARINLLRAKSMSYAQYQVVFPFQSTP